MELTKQERDAIYWRGAIGGAIKGIPQGLMLGALAACVLFGGIYAFGFFAGPAAAQLAYGFGSFLFTTGISAGATTLPTIGANIFAVFNPIPVIVLNTVLTAIGNFLSGGDQAVAAAKQQKQNDYLDAKLMQVEGRERQIEQVISQHLAHEPQPLTAPRHVQKILEEGPRIKVEKPRDSHAEDAVTSRLEAAERTIH
ncbi:MAG: hypothetical protein ACOYJ2_08420 [Rickettsiales bacterium]